MNQDEKELEKLKVKRRPSTLDQRWNLWANPKFQVKIIGYILFWMLISFVACYLLDLYIFSEIINTSGSKEFTALMTKIKSRLALLYFVSFLVISFFAFIFGLIISHRIAGPIFKLNKFLDKLADGQDTGKLFFRKKDFFAEIGDHMNAYLVSIGKLKK